MAESEIDIYNLNSEERNQSLKLSILNNKQISIILTNNETEERYIGLFSLAQLKSLCKAFLITKSIKDALNLIKKVVESGKIILIAEPNGESWDINLDTGEYLPFNLKVDLEQKKNNENILPPKFDYRGNKEAEKKYGNTTENTTEYSEDIIKSNVKPPIMQLEYIEPIIQVHYPDGTTESKQLPPIIQGMNGKMPNISEEQFQLIREQMNKNVGLKNFSPIKDNYLRSNSEAQKNSYYSTKTSLNPNQNNLNIHINQSRNIINNNIYSDNMNYKTISDYSTMTVQKKPFVVPNLNYSSQIPNPTLFNNNYDFTPRLNTNNNIFEQRPRIINQKNGNRSSSTPNQIINRYNSNQNHNMFQPNPTNNPFQTNHFYEQNNSNNIKIPYDRNTEKPKINNKFNLNQEPKEKTKKKNRRKTSNANTKKINQIKKISNQNQIKQVKSYTNQSIQYQQQYRNLLSQEINQEKTQMFSQPQNTQFQKKSSTPIPTQTPNLVDGQNDIYSQISQQQIALAQMASMQNQENPNFKNLEAITLSQNAQLVEQTQQYNYNNYNENQGEEEEQEQMQEEGINIEALFITNEGRVIFRNGLLRGIIHKYAEIDDVVSKIQDILLKGAKFHLVYKAFDLDDNAKTFHEKCDDLDMSLVLIETKKDARFGGFTTKSWKGNCIKKIDDNAFVFNLDTNKIFDVIPNEPAVGCYPKFGPVFFGCQIRIYDEFFSRGGSTCHRGLNYKTRKDFELNNGEQKYLVKDIEVYKIERIDVD